MATRPRRCLATAVLRRRLRSLVPVTRDELLDSLAARLVGAPTERPYRVAVNGPVAVGKSLFTGDLCDRIAGLGRAVRTVSVDGFRRSARERVVGESIAVHLYERVLDLELLRDRVLVPLGPRGSVAPGGDPRYLPGNVDRATGKALPDETLGCPRDAIFVVDGVLLFKPVVVGHWDCRVYLDAPLDVTRERAVARNATYPAFPDDDAVRAHYESNFVPLLEHYEAEVRPRERADVLIDYADLERPRLV